jgi:eukaryotic-like serine/threonine-protein kinase
VFPVEPIPEWIGAYRVLRRLAAPGPAETFLGRVEGPRGLARECVLKRMKNTIEGDTRLAEELTREAAICARIDHPAILRMMDFFEDRGQLVLALEYVDGTSLDQLLEHLAEHRQKLGDAAAFYIGHRLAGALAHAHAATDEHGVPTPIIHRNLHPSNVVIGADGDVRLTGFGVGKILGRTPDTAIGTIKGTPGYMAPEQARGEPVTAKADTYGLGLLLWSLLTGKKPPSDGTWPAKITSLRRDLPREIAAMIDAALDRFPGTRRITCSEIERWLGKVASDEQGRRELKEQMLSLPAELGADDLEAEPEATTLPPVAPAPAPANPFQGVRFGPPAPLTPPEVTIAAAPPAAPKGRGDWRQSLPDVDSLDELIDSVRAPDRSRASEPTLPRARAFPPAPPLPPAPIAAPVITPAPAPVAVPVITPAPIAAPGITPAPAPVVTPAPVAAAAAAIPIVAAQRAPVASSIVAPSVAAAEAPPPTPPPEAAIPAPVFGSPPVFSPGPPPVASSQPRTIGLPEGVPPPPRPRAPSPSLLAASRRTLGTWGTVAVSALTATVVVVLAFVLRERPAGPRVGASAEAARPPSAPAHAVYSTTMVAASASASAAPPSTANLPAGFGYLTVVSPAVAHVYISGKRLGPANEALQVRCGRWFVRLAVPREGRYPEWVSRGETVDVGCQAATRIEILPAPEAPRSSPGGKP